MAMARGQAQEQRPAAPEKTLPSTAPMFPPAAPGAKPIYLIITLVQKLWFGIDAPGYASLLIVMLLLNGLLLLSNGIQGEYIARIFEEVKGRPLYVVGKRFGFAEEAKKRKATVEVVKDVAAGGK